MHSGCASFRDRGAEPRLGTGATPMTQLPSRGESSGGRRSLWIDDHAHRNEGRCSGLGADPTSDLTVVTLSWAFRAFEVRKLFLVPSTSPSINMQRRIDYRQFDRTRWCAMTSQNRLPPLRMCCVPKESFRTCPASVANSEQPLTGDRIALGPAGRVRLLLGDLRAQRS